MAGQVTKEYFDKRLIYPPFSNIRKISAEIAANVAAKAYELGEHFHPWYSVKDHKLLSCVSHCLVYAGVATRLPRPENLVKYAESCMYTPSYRSYR